MTGGTVVVLGPTGRNFAAGMSGGIAYVLDPERVFAGRCNLEMVLLERLESKAEEERIRLMLERHAAYTGSGLAECLLARWELTRQQFVRVIPKDYKRMREHIALAEASGMTGKDALHAAFMANVKDLTRAGGN